MQRSICVTVVLAFAMAGCTAKKESPSYTGANLPPDVAGNTSPSAFTVELNEAVRGQLPLDDPQDFEDARRGLIASDPALEVAGPGVR